MKHDICHPEKKYSILTSKKLIVMKKLHIWVVIIFLGFVACSKDDSEPTPTPPPGPAQENSITFNIQYNVDGQSIIRDSILYYNEAGNQYSIYNLLYYLSEIKLTKSDGNTVLLKNIHYVDCFDPATNTFILKNIPAGEYSGISFNIGIDSLHNEHDSLPNTVENINMEWPDMMGGGFHFLRLEGYFTDAGNNYGYAMHIGTNPCLIPVQLPNAITVTAESQTNLTLKMNVNEWFRNPNTYDFNIDGNYTMGNMPLMMKITENGHDVFTF